MNQTRFLMAAVTLSASLLSAANIQKAKEIAINSSGLASDEVAPRLVTGDVNGDGKVDWVFSSGTRYLRVYDHNGTELWNKMNPNGVKNMEPWHPWCNTVWDLDNDGKCEVIGFQQKGTSNASRAWLVIWDGASGIVKNEVELWFNPSTTSHARRGMAAIAYMRSKTVPDIIVLGDDYGSEIAAYDTKCNQLWQKIHHTPSDDKWWEPGGGHYPWIHDLTGDGLDEVVNGRFIFDKNGTIRDTMQFGTHADGLVCADIRPDIPGMEIALVGDKGAFMFNINPTTLQSTKVWQIAQTVIRNPQNIGMNDFDKSNPGLELCISERGSETNPATFLVKRDGTVLRKLGSSISATVMPVDIDGNRDEVNLMLWHGQIRNKTGALIVTTGWYGGNGNWQTWYPYAFAQDILDDPREEILVWTKTKLVIGKNADPAPGSMTSHRDNREYKLCFANKYLNRCSRCFDYKSPPSDAVASSRHRSAVLNQTAAVSAQARFPLFDLRGRALAGYAGINGLYSGAEKRAVANGCYCPAGPKGAAVVTPFSSAVKKGDK